MKDGSLVQAVAGAAFEDVWEYNSRGPTYDEEKFPPARPTAVTPRIFSNKQTADGRRRAESSDLRHIRCVMGRGQHLGEGVRQPLIGFRSLPGAVFRISLA